MINDNIISDLFFGNRQLKSNVYKKYKNDYDSEIYQYIINRFKDSKSFDESLYRIKYKVYIRPVCEECGKELKFIKGNGKDIFNRFCCKKCANNNELSKKRLKETCLKKYGVDNPAKSQQFKDKYIKYIQEKYNDPTITNAWQAKEVKEKCQETCLKHYGVKNFGASKQHQEKLKNQYIIDKRNKTKKEKHTFNTSIPEKKSYKLLKEKYTDVQYQYRSEEYPFNCDFYIPSLDLYIECNYHWTHGFHPYNKDNIEDQNKLQEWKNKNTKYYYIAINTWTKRDINKRNIAKQNNLNFIEFWNINELKEWINKS